MDNIKLEILKDGTIKIETDSVTAPNHTNAEGLIHQLIVMAGGETTRIEKPGAQFHTHDSGVCHEH